MEEGFTQTAVKRPRHNCAEEASIVPQPGDHDIATPLADSEYILDHGIRQQHPGQTTREAGAGDDCSTMDMDDEPSVADYCFYLEDQHLPKQQHPSHHNWSMIRTMTPTRETVLSAHKQVLSVLRRKSE